MSSIPLHTTSFRGLGEVTIRELRGAFGQDVLETQQCCVRDYDVTRFRFVGPVEDLYRLRTVEDIFYSIGVVPMTGSRTDLRLFEDVGRSAITAELLRHARRRSSRRGTTFRVIVQASDVAWRHYRRKEIQRAFERGIDLRFTRWKKVEDNAQLEFWVQQIGREALLGLRLSDRTMRHRDYKEASLPASLRPTVARSLVCVSGVQPSDVVVDPMCGVGTLLIERALAGRHRALLGGDISERAVLGAAHNFGRKHRPRIICRWDAVAIPLLSGSADKIICNLPWGHLVGSKDSLEQLYRGVLSEAHRVLKPEGQAALLTSETDLVCRVLRSSGGWRLSEHLREVRVLGREADIFVIGHAAN